MGEPTFKNEALDPRTLKVKALVSLVLIFGALITAWALTFPPIFYSLFVK